MDFLKRKAFYIFICLLSSVTAFILCDRLHVFRDIIIKRKYDDNSVGFKKQYLDIITNLKTEKVDTEDTNLVYLQKTVFMEKPSQLPYNLTKPHIRDPSPGQAKLVDNILNHKTNGFFIECGANSGERRSNTLFFERYRNWTGILIEPNPVVFKELRTKHRKAYSIQACLSIHTYPSVESLFYKDTATVCGNIVGRKCWGRGKGFHVKVRCVPLYSILLALGNPKVDYFSLDIEGAERGVLESIPWGKVDIQLMSIEYQFWSGGKGSLKRFMEKQGYKYISQIKAGGWDMIVQKQQNVKI